MQMCVDSQRWLTEAVCTMHMNENRLVMDRLDIMMNGNANHANGAQSTD